MSTPLDNVQLAAICKGDEQAMDFLERTALWFAAVDDLVDGDITYAEHTIRCCVQPFELATHPFFLRTPVHTVALREIILAIANTYADSVAWEKAEDEWKRQHAECLRHCGCDLVTTVARLCAGGSFEHARSLSAAQRELCHRTQYPEEK